MKIKQLSPVWAKVIGEESEISYLRSKVGFTQVLWKFNYHNVCQFCTWSGLESKLLYGNCPECGNRKFIKTKINNKKMRTSRWVSFIASSGFFGAGLLVEIGKKYGIECSSIPVQKRELISTISLRDYQQELAQIALQKGRGIIEAATGSGKTVIAMALTESIRSCLFIVHTTSLLDQSFARFSTIPELEVGKMGGGTKHWDTVTVATIQTLSKLLKKGDLDFTSKFNMVIVDEAHHASSKTYQDLLFKMKSPYRFGLTATPHTLWSQEEYMKVTRLLGPVISSVSYTRLKEEGFVADCEVYLYPCKTPPILSRKWHDVYTEGVVFNEGRNQLIATKTKEQARKGKTVLILVSQIQHGEAIKQFLPEAFCVYSTVKDIVQEETKELLIQKKIKVVISTTVWKEGVDIPSLDVLINASGEKSCIPVIQKAGRVLRPKEGKALLIDFMDTGTFIGNHAAERKKIYEEVGFTVVEKY